MLMQIKFLLKRKLDFDCASLVLREALSELYEYKVSFDLICLEVLIAVPL